MSNDTNKRSSPEPLDKLPQVRLVIAGNQKIEQDYENLVIIQKSPSSVINFFNENIEGDGYHLFLDKGVSLTNSAISTMIGYLLKHDVFRGVYTDSTTCNFPAYNYKYFNVHEDMSILFNVPLLCKGIDFKFRNIELYYHAFIFDFVQKYFIYHLAEPLIKLNKNIIPQHIEELKKSLQGTQQNV